MSSGYNHETSLYQLIINQEHFRRIEEMLLLWKRSLLSKSEGVTLTESTLSSIHIYLMSLLAILVDIANRLEKTKLNFIGCDGVKTRRYHLVALQALIGFSRGHDWGYDL